MEFKSKICTTIEQSKRLLELGLKKETADMVYQEIGVTPFNKWKEHKIQEDFFPAWSLHRLIELCPEYINIDGYADTSYLIKIYKHDNKIVYENDYNRWIYLGDGDNLFDTFIDCIEWLIKEGHFNKEYLKEV